MQLSIKTPPELTLPTLEKCAELAERFPSHFVTDCVWQCLKWMDLPHHADRPLDMVDRYYHALGRENEIRSQPDKKAGFDVLLQKLAEKDRARRAREAAQRRTEFRAGLKRQPLSKHLHLKISEGLDHLPKRIKEKSVWLRLSPNALVVACLRDCLAAMDDSKKAVVPLPIVIDFWTVSHAKLRRKATNVFERGMMHSYEKMLRERGGPILDTIVRLALAEKWETSLKQILRDADVLPRERSSKR
jgi:hypothetical protein